MGLASTFGVQGLTSTLGIQVKTPTPPKGPPWWGLLDPPLIGAITGFQNAPSPWDVIRYGPNNVLLPGLVKVRRIKRRMKLHRKEHPASDFETQTFQGYSELEFDFDLFLWSPGQWQNMPPAMNYLYPASGTPKQKQQTTLFATVTSTSNLVNPQASSTAGTQTTQQIQQARNTPLKPPIPVKMSHPALQFHNVDAVVIHDVEGPIQAHPNVPDIFVMHFQCVEFNPSKAIQTTTFKQANSLGTPLGQLNQGGLGILQPNYLPPEQDPQQSPSSSGGANPFGAGGFSNFLPPNYVEQF